MKQIYLAGDPKVAGAGVKDNTENLLGCADGNLTIVPERLK
jgi:hypothetical protein